MTIIDRIISTLFPRWAKARATAAADRAHAHKRSEWLKAHTLPPSQRALIGGDDMREKVTRYTPASRRPSVWT